MDGPDAVVELDEFPPLSPGAPTPVVLADESSVQLAYVVPDSLSTWSGLDPSSVHGEELGELYAVARFKDVCAHYLGLPNDEALPGHPLSSRGLKPYAISEVLKSSWIRSLERMNSVHPRHRPESFRRYRHFLFAFHDFVFECVAAESAVTLFRGTAPALVSAMADPPLTVTSLALAP